MESDPFAVLEGMALAGYAIGATRGFVYVRSEYPDSAPALRRAVEAARAAGLLGNAGRGERVLVRRRGGRRGGVLRVRRRDGAPPLARGAPRDGHRAPAVSRREGALREAHRREQRRDARQHRMDRAPWGRGVRALGIGKSRGTKAVSLNERFVRPGMYEVPFGMPLRTSSRTSAAGSRKGARSRPSRSVARSAGSFRARSSTRRSASMSSTRSVRSWVTAESSPGTIAWTRATSRSTSSSSATRSRAASASRAGSAGGAGSRSRSE